MIKITQAGKNAQCKNNVAQMKNLHYRVNFKCNSPNRRIFLETANKKFIILFVKLNTNKGLSNI